MTQAIPASLELVGDKKTQSSQWESNTRKQQWGVGGRGKGQGRRGPGLPTGASQGQDRNRPVGSGPGGGRRTGWEQAWQDPGHQDIVHGRPGEGSKGCSLPETGATRAGRRAMTGATQGLGRILFHRKGVSWRPGRGAHCVQ